VGARQLVLERRLVDGGGYDFIGFDIDLLQQREAARRGGG